jgi:hypothetical protein
MSRRSRTLQDVLDEQPLVGDEMPEMVMQPLYWIGGLVGLLLLALLGWAIAMTVLYAQESNESAPPHCRKLRQSDLPLVVNISGSVCYYLVHDLNASRLEPGTPAIEVFGGNVEIDGRGFSLESDCTRRGARNVGAGLLHVHDMHFFVREQCTDPTINGLRVDAPGAALVENCTFEHFRRAVYGLAARELTVRNVHVTATMPGDFAGVTGIVYYGSGVLNVFDSTVDIANPEQYDFESDFSIGVWTGSFPYGVMPPLVTLDNVQSTASFGIQVSAALPGSVVRNSRVVITNDYPIAFAYGVATNNFDEFYMASLEIVNSSAQIGDAVPAAYGLAAWCTELLVLDNFRVDGPTGYFPPTFGFTEAQATGAISITPFPLESVSAPGTHNMQVIVRNSVLRPTSANTPAIFVGYTPAENNVSIPFHASVVISATTIQSISAGFGVFTAPNVTDVYVGQDNVIDGPYYGAYFFNGTSTSQFRGNTVDNACVGVRVGGDTTLVGQPLTSSDNEIKNNDLSSGVAVAIVDDGTATEIENNTPADGTPCTRVAPPLPPLTNAGFVTSAGATAVRGCGSHMLAICTD